MKRSTIIICISYILFVGLNISLSVVLINKIKMHNTQTTSVVLTQELADGEILVVDNFQPETKTDFTSTIKTNFSKIKEAIIEEAERITSSRDRQEEVKNYIPLNPVYNFLQ